MPSSVDLDIYQGTEFNLRLSLKDASCNPFNLSGYSAQGRIRFHYSDITGIWDISVIPTSGYYASGYLDLFIPATGTATFPVTKGVYDIQIYNNSNYVEQVVKGYANIYPDTFITYTS
jgi:hypothetical protein